MARGDVRVVVSSLVGRSRAGSSRILQKRYSAAIRRFVSYALRLLARHMVGIPFRRAQHLSLHKDSGAGVCGLLEDSLSACSLPQRAGRKEAKFSESVRANGDRKCALPVGSAVQNIALVHDAGGSDQAP